MTVDEQIEKCRANTAFMERLRLRHERERALYERLATR